MHLDKNTLTLTHQQFNSYKPVNYKQNEKKTSTFDAAIGALGSLTGVDADDIEKEQNLCVLIAFR